MDFTQRFMSNITLHTVYSLIIHVRVMIIDFNHHRLQQTLKYPCSAISYIN